MTVRTYDNVIARLIKRMWQLLSKSFFFQWFFFVKNWQNFRNLPKFFENCSHVTCHKGEPVAKCLKCSYETAGAAAIRTSKSDCKYLQGTCCHSVQLLIDQSLSEDYLYFADYRSLVHPCLKSYRVSHKQNVCRTEVSNY